jgi:hypothetical protein
MRRYLSLLPILPLAFAGLSCTTQPVGESRQRCEDHPLHASLRTAHSPPLHVVVTLATDGAAPAPRIQDRLLATLEGTDFTVLRRPDNFPVLTLRVAEDAFCRLVASTLVVGIELDRAVPPAGG